MEEKIEIKTTTTEEDLLGIINGNTAEEVANAFREYMTKQTSDWYDQYDRANKAEKELADWLIAQGVDHVIGSHPHVLQPMEVKADTQVNDKHLVVYSLGNFISNMSKVHTDGGAMVKLELKKLWGITRLEKCSYSLVWTSRPVLSGKRKR